MSTMRSRVTSPGQVSTLHRKAATSGTVCVNAVKLSASSSLNALQWDECLADHDYRCAYCGAPELFTGSLAQEHCVPQVHGGGLVQGNIVPACKACNSRKHTLTTVEFIWKLAKEARNGAAAFPQ